ncbi:hypothetical protein JCM21900_005807 [Sporobolomyces salmonicolor]
MAAVQASAASSATPQQPPRDSHTTRLDVIDTEGGRILCVADVRGALSTLNTLAAEHSAVAIIHSGDFGFYEPSSLSTISDRTLKHLVQYSSLISSAFRSQLLSPNMTPAQMRELLAHPPKSANPSSDSAADSSFVLSEFPKLLSGELKLNVPVYTVWGACEDVAVLEKIRLAPPSALSVPSDPSKLPPVPPTTASRPSAIATSAPNYSIPNLTVLDEATTRVLLIGGVRLRLFGLGGAVVPHKLFDNGAGTATIAGGQGTMWTTMLQIGEIVDTAQKVYDPTETRLLVSHASPGREGLLAQLALVLKADLTVSAGLHFRYGVSYNEFSVQHDPSAFKGKLEAAKKSFNDVWDAVKAQVEGVVDDNQKALLSNALAVANRVPATAPVQGGPAAEETAWKNCWNWNLPDAAFGNLVLDIRGGRVGSELKSQGFNFAYRSSAPRSNPPAVPSGAVLAAPSTTPSAPPTFPSNLSQRSAATNHFGPGAASGRAGSHHPHQRAPSGPRGGGRGGFTGSGGWNTGAPAPAAAPAPVLAPAGAAPAPAAAAAPSTDAAKPAPGAAAEPPTTAPPRGGRPPSQPQQQHAPAPAAPARPASQPSAAESTPVPPTAPAQKEQPQSHSRSQSQQPPAKKATTTTTPSSSDAVDVSGPSAGESSGPERDAAGTPTPGGGGDGPRGARGARGAARGGAARGARGRSNGEWRGGSGGGRGGRGGSARAAAGGEGAGAGSESKPAPPVAAAPSPAAT